MLSDSGFIFFWTELFDDFGAVDVIIITDGHTLLYIMKQSF